MPKVSEFFGITIYVYWSDHSPAHFHSRYAGHKASISIEQISVIAGSLPPRALGLVMEWAALHRQELRDVWEDAMKHEPIRSIEPLC